MEKHKSMEEPYPYVVQAVIHKVQMVPGPLLFLLFLFSDLNPFGRLNMFHHNLSEIVYISQCTSYGNS